jgi:hypothetical protein
MSRQPEPPLLSPTDPTLAASCLDFLLIELVPLAHRITDQLQARDAALREEYKRSQIFHDQPVPPTPTTTGNKEVGGEREEEGKTATGTATDVASTTAGTGVGAGGIDEETRDKVFWRLDSLGYRVGQGLVER